MYSNESYSFPYHHYRQHNSYEFSIWVRVGTFGVETKWSISQHWQIYDCAQPNDLQLLVCTCIYLGSDQNYPTYSNNCHYVAHGYIQKASISDKWYSTVIIYTLHIVSSFHGWYLFRPTWCILYRIWTFQHVEQHMFGIYQIRI